MPIAGEFLRFSGLLYAFGSAKEAAIDGYLAVYGDLLEGRTVRVRG